MRTYCLAQGTLLSALWWPKWERNPQKRYVCMNRADWLCCTADTDTAVWSNYTPVFFFLKEEKARIQWKLETTASMAKKM